MMKQMQVYEAHYAHHTSCARDIVTLPILAALAASTAYAYCSLSWEVTMYLTADMPRNRRMESIRTLRE